MPKEKEVLEYEVYGWFKFTNEPEGVRALGRQWVVAEHVAACVTDWDDHADEFTDCSPLE